MAPSKVIYLNTAGDMANQNTIAAQIKAFLSRNSLKDYYYQIYYTGADAIITYNCWDEDNQCYILQGQVNASSVEFLPPAVQSVTGFPII